MGEKRVGSVIVNSKGRPAGIFTERRLLSKFLVPAKSLNELIGSASSSPKKTAEAGIRIQKTAKIMAAQYVKRLP
jgi:CBS domain-containing protein